MRLDFNVVCTGAVSSALVFFEISRKLSRLYGSDRVIIVSNRLIVGPDYTFLDPKPKAFGARRNQAAER